MPTCRCPRCAGWPSRRVTLRRPPGPGRPQRRAFLAEEGRVARSERGIPVGRRPHVLAPRPRREPGKGRRVSEGPRCAVTPPGTRADSSRAPGNVALLGANANQQTAPRPCRPPRRLDAPPRRPSTGSRPAPSATPPTSAMDDRRTPERRPAQSAPTRIPRNTNGTLARSRRAVSTRPAAAPSDHARRQPNREPSSAQRHVAQPPRRRRRGRHSPAPLDPRRRGSGEAALADALRGATAAGEWAVVSQLAAELEARRRAREAQQTGTAAVIPLLHRRRGMP